MIDMGQVSTQEQVQDLKSLIVEHPSTFQYSCFHLEFQGLRVNDFIELSDVKGLAAGAEMKLIEDPYTEKEARMHMVRIRELIGAAGDRVDTLHGISAGLSLHDAVLSSEISHKGFALNGTQNKRISPEAQHALSDYDFNAPASIQTLLEPVREQPPKTIKSICASAWNPPPYHFRQKGHLLYLQLTTNEGEQYQITSHVTGFFVNKSSNTKFDPFPRSMPKSAAAHSLLSLISLLSPSFSKAFTALQEANNKRDILVNYQLTNALPANPWLVPSTNISLTAHQSDPTRSQETYLMTGAENAETLRDWNEEFQSIRELPRESVQDRVFRERLTSKLFADYNEAAARGAVLVARGEVPSLNPTEGKDAQIFVYNNVFYSFGADGVGTFASEGGDEAARVAVGKDVMGIKAVNQLDITGLFTPGTVVIDYLGKRIVSQSIVPGIFKQREPGENQIDYGGVEGKDVVADNEIFETVFSQLSKALRVKQHPVWDKEGKKHVLEGSVETKGLLGTDSRKYVLDLYRLTPLDVTWIEKYWTDKSDKGRPKDQNYPHRMAILRPELIEGYWRLKMSEYVKAEVEKKRSKITNSTASNEGAVPFEGDSKAESIEADKVEQGIKTGSENENSQTKSNDEVVRTADENRSSKSDEVESNLEKPQDHVDISAFSLTLNPDVFCGQVPQTDEEAKDMLRDEQDVRNVCDYLRHTVMPELVEDLKTAEVGFPMDGPSLSRLMHKRGINIRYLGELATMSKEQGPRLKALVNLAIQEMVVRAFKHVSAQYLKNLPVPFSGACLAHLLNCLLGASFNSAPKPQIDDETKFFYPDADYSFETVDIQSLRGEIASQVHLRYRYDLQLDWFHDIKHLQLLREVALKLGLQLVARDFQFGTQANGHSEQTPSTVNGHLPETGANGVTNGANGKKKKKTRDHSPTNSANESNHESTLSFSPDDIANVVPIIKDACPKSTLAEEALEAGRLSMMQNQKELGQELLLESLQLHEQIYGILHPEVARMYHQMSMLYYQLEEKNFAADLARKAVIISERTLGIDSNETILSYLNLGLFEHAIGNTNVALLYMRHALELWKVLFGPRHPDSITTINNAAVMLQTLKHYHESRLWFEASLAICIEQSGRESVNTATLEFQLAQALALDQDPKLAVNHMRESYSIFLAKLGPDDPNTKESEGWLERLTQNAVSIAKNAKDLQDRRLRKFIYNPRVTLGTRPQALVGQSPVAASSGSGEVRSGGRGLDSRSIEELIRYIEGASEPQKKKSKRKRITRMRGPSIAGS